MADKETSSGSHYRVAFDLAQKIFEAEHGYGSSGTTGSPDRAYWLELYRDCLRATLPSTHVSKGGY